MAADVVMPRLSDSMEEGTILRWLKSVGDEVKRGDELVEIETDKANMTYEATDEGVLIEIVAEEGDTLPIGEVDRPHRRSQAKKAGRPRDEGADAARAERGHAESRARRRRPPRPQRAASAPAPGRRPTATGASRPRRSRGGWRGS